MASLIERNGLHRSELTAKTAHRIQATLPRMSQMRTLNFVGGEKGGVGKSVVSRLLAQYFIDRSRPFTGFDTDRSHRSFARFYADHASPIIVDNYEGLDNIVAGFDQSPDEGPAGGVVVDLAAQTADPLARWIKDSDLLTLMPEMGVTVNFWHVADAGQESVDLLERLVTTYGDEANYIVVKNAVRGRDFAPLERSAGFKSALVSGADVISVALLQETCMRKIDRQNATFAAALLQRVGPDALGLLERQRLRTWLNAAYAEFGHLVL